MKAIDKNGNDITAKVINDSYKRMGYKWIVRLGEGHKTMLKEEHWDMAMKYAEMGYKVEEII